MVVFCGVIRQGCMGVADIVLRHGRQMVLKLVFGKGVMVVIYGLTGNANIMRFLILLACKSNMMVLHLVTWQDRVGIVQTFIRNGNQMLVRCIIANAHQMILSVFFSDTNKMIFMRVSCNTYAGLALQMVGTDASHSFMRCIF